MAKHELKFDAYVFSLNTVKRALYRFSDQCTFDIQFKDNMILVVLDSSAGENLIVKIKHEVLDQDLRESIAKETATIRTLILANAFSNSSLIQQ